MPNYVINVENVFQERMQMFNKNLMKYAEVVLSFFSKFCLMCMTSFATAATVIAQHSTMMDGCAGGKESSKLIELGG